MFVITQIHRRGDDVRCPEILVMLLSEFYHIWYFHHTRMCLLNVKYTLGTATNLPLGVSILKGV